MFSDHAGEGNGAGTSAGAILNVKAEVTVVVDLSIKKYEFAPIRCIE